MRFLDRQRRIRQGRPCGILLLLLIACFPVPIFAAEATFSLPLQGHYRPGRYMPLRISAQTDSANDRLTSAQTGQLTTEIAAVNGHIDGIVPWLSIREFTNVNGPPPPGSIRSICRCSRWMKTTG